jgi:hypothetical protein
VTLSDVDDTLLTGAIVSIGSGFAPDEDVLSFVDQPGITGSYDGASGVLTLSGTATVADYQAALRTVTYENVSADPTTTTREVKIEVNDTSGGTASAARAVKLTASNDAPITGGILDVAVEEDAPRATIDLFAAFSDAEDSDGALVYTVRGNTNPKLFTSVTVDGAEGTLALDFAPDRNGSARLTVRATDTDGAFVETTFTVAVNAVNDAPSLTNSGGASAPQDGSIVIDGSMLKVTDVDNAPDDIIFTLTAAPRDGTLSLGTVVLGAGDTFSQQDINAGRLTFAAGAVDDGFEFTVSDGAGGVVGQTGFDIDVIAPVIPSTPYSSPEAPTVSTDPPAASDPETQADEMEPDDDEQPVVPTTTMRFETTPDLSGRHAPTEAPNDETEPGPTTGSISLEAETRQRSTRRAAVPEARGAPVVEDAAEVVAVPEAAPAQPAPQADLDFVASAGKLWDDLNRMDQRLTSSSGPQLYVAGAATFVVAGLSAGYVVSLLRGTYLLGTLLSSMPAWQMVDPLPILDSFDGGVGGSGRSEDVTDDESLASMIESRGEQPDGRI